MESDLNFTICHSIGNITYDTNGFISKNKDQLRADLVELLNDSPNPGTQTLPERVLESQLRISASSLRTA